MDIESILRDVKPVLVKAYMDEKECIRIYSDGHIEKFERNKQWN